MSSSQSKRRKRVGSSPSPVESQNVVFSSHASASEPNDEDLAYDLEEELQETEVDEENDVDEVIVVDEVATQTLRPNEREAKKKGGSDVKVYLPARQMKGPFWVSYKRYKDADDKIKAECIHCLKSYAAHPSVNGTTHLRDHFQKCLSNPANQGKDSGSSYLHRKLASCKVFRWRS